MIFGEIDVSKIVFDLKSRDDIPKILRGLQALYTNIPVRTGIFELLQNLSTGELRGCGGFEFCKSIYCD